MLHSVTTLRLVCQEVRGSFHDRICTPVFCAAMSVLWMALHKGKFPLLADTLESAAGISGKQRWALILPSRARASGWTDAANSCRCLGRCICLCDWYEHHCCGAYAQTFCCTPPECHLAGHGDVSVEVRCGCRISLLGHYGATNHCLFCILVQVGLSSVCSWHPVRPFDPQECLHLFYEVATSGQGVVVTGHLGHSCGQVSLVLCHVIQALGDLNSVQGFSEWKHHVHLDWVLPLPWRPHLAAPETKDFLTTKIRVVNNMLFPSTHFHRLGKG